MALTNEILKANTALSGLTDEQLTAITTLSANDESTVIGKRVGEIYREMDVKIEAITGVKRDGDEKTYIYLERATNGFKEKAEKASGFETKIQELEATKARLEKAITEGAQDKETKAKLDQATADLTSITEQYNTLKSEFDSVKQTHQSELFSVKVSNDISAATQGLKFKSELPESVTKILLDNAVAKIQAQKPEYVDNGQGGKVLVFKDANGAHMRNPENGLNFFSAAELIQKELKDVLATDKPKGGGGTGGNEGGGTGGALTISGAKTRLEANEIIHKDLTAKGLTVGSDEYQKGLDEAWEENNVLSLPEK